MYTCSDDKAWRATRGNNKDLKMVNERANRFSFNVRECPYMDSRLPFRTGLKNAMHLQYKRWAAFQGNFVGLEHAVKAIRIFRTVMFSVNCRVLSFNVRMMTCRRCCCANYFFTPSLMEVEFPVLYVLCE